MNAETKHPGFTALAAASAGNTPVQPSIVKLLLEAKADASIAFSLPHMPHGPKRTPHEWATSQGRKEVVSIFSMAEYENDEPRFIAKVQQATKESADRGAAALRLIRASLRGGDVAALAEQLATDAAARPYPQGEVPTSGGRCRLQGLQGAADLNGSTGHIIDWNADGRRRYCVRLESSGRKISCKMRNVVAVDNPKVAYPHDFDCSSAVFAAALQAELRAQGFARTVLDWTPLAGAVSDVVYLLHVAHDVTHISSVAAQLAPLTDGSRLIDSGCTGDGNLEHSGERDEVEKAVAVCNDAVEAQDVLIVVCSTPETMPFFLAHRELIGPAAALHTNTELAALPWLVISKDVTMVPQPWEQCCKKDYMVRLCLNLGQSKFTCAICHEESPYADSPSQMPCAHFTCTSCLKQLCPPMSALERIHKLKKAHGLTCPVCRTHFPKHSLAEHASAPGGVAIFEYI